MRIRRAFLLALADRYATLVVGLLLIATMSRLLTPHEIGVSVLGSTVLAFVEILRDVPTGYLIQCATVTVNEMRVAFTTMLLVTGLASAGLILGAGPIAIFLGVPDVVPYLHVLALTLLTGPIERPLVALMRRNMQFGRIAVVNFALFGVNAVVCVGLGLAGFGAMSFAWALLAANGAACLLALRFGVDWTIYRPRLRGWRAPLRFSGTSSLWGGILRLAEALPSLMLGAGGNLDAVGMYGRAQTIGDMPAKLMLAGIGPVAYPAFAAEQRAGRSLAPQLMLATEYITAVHWPVFLLLACLAHPVVLLLLGEKWLGIVPVVQLICLARLFSAFDVLVYPALMTCGALGSLLLSALLSLVAYAVVLWITAPYGLLAIAASQLLLVPLCGAVGLACVRRAIPFDIGEFGRALCRSAGVTACSAVGPMAVLATAGFRFDLSLAAAVVAACAAALGWLAGLWLVRHPLRHEVVHVTAALTRAGLWRHAYGWVAGRGPA